MSMALELRGVRKSFGATEIIRGATLGVAAGERVAVIGPNGAGKSTLFNLISGRLAPSAGDILLNGRSIAGCRPAAIRRQGLSRSFQITHVFANLSTFDNLRCALLPALGRGPSLLRRLSSLRDVNARAESLLERIGLAARRDEPAANLTYAEQRALEIGVTVAGDASVVLLDEPTAGMSKSETARFVQLIREVTHGRTLLMVEHDMSVVFGLADKIAVLVYGEVIACDRPEAVRRDARVQEAYLGSAVAHAQAEAV
jgi:branched-chain amino acid transport system ATP-binding protein